MNRTPSVDQGTGPLYSFSLIFDGVENAVAPESEGSIRVSGRVIDGSGRRVCFPDALIEFIRGDQFARAQSDSDGNYHVFLRKPKVERLKDGTLQAPYFDVVLFIHPVMDSLRTRMYFPDEAAANATDPALNRVPQATRPTLIAKMQGKGLQFDIVLQGDDQTVFFQPEP